MSDQNAPVANSGGQGTGLTWDIVEATIKTIQARINEKPTIYYGISDAVSAQDLGRRPIFYAVSARSDGVMDLIVCHPDNFAKLKEESERLGFTLKPASERPIERPGLDAARIAQDAQAFAKILFLNGMGRASAPPDEIGPPGDPRSS